MILHTYEDPICMTVVHQHTQLKYLKLKKWDEPQGPSRPSDQTPSWQGALPTPASPPPPASRGTFYLHLGHHDDSLFKLNDNLTPRLLPLLPPLTCGSANAAPEKGYGEDSPRSTPPKPVESPLLGLCVYRDSEVLVSLIVEVYEEIYPPVPSTRGSA